MKSLVQSIWILMNKMFIEQDTFEMQNKFVEF